MARKLCPQCKLLTGASTTTCSGCGHAFAPTALVATKGRPKRCPMCGIANEASVHACQCGHAFDTDPAKLRDLMRSQRTVARVMLVCSVFLGIAGVVVPLALMALARIASLKLAIVIPFVALTAAAAGARKATRILYTTRIGLDELDGRDEVVPTARVIERK